MNLRLTVAVAGASGLVAAVAGGWTSAGDAAAPSAHRAVAAASPPFSSSSSGRVSPKVRRAYRAFERHATPARRRASYSRLLAEFASLRDHATARSTASTNVLGVVLSASPAEVCISYALPPADAPQTGAGGCNSNLADVALGGLFVVVPAEASGNGVPTFVEMVPNATRSVALTDRSGQTRTATPSDNMVRIPDPAYSASAGAFRSLTVTSTSGQQTTW